MGAGKGGGGIHVEKDLELTNASIKTKYPVRFKKKPEVRRTTGIW